MHDLTLSELSCDSVCRIRCCLWKFLQSYAAFVASQIPLFMPRWWHQKLQCLSRCSMPWHQLPVTMPRLWHQVRHCPYRECYAAFVALSPMPRLWHLLHVSECSLSVQCCIVAHSLSFAQLLLCIAFRVSL